MRKILACSVGFISPSGCVPALPFGIVPDTCPILFSCLSGFRLRPEGRSRQLHATAQPSGLSHAPCRASHLPLSSDHRRGALFRQRPAGGHPRDFRRRLGTGRKSVAFSRSHDARGFVDAPLVVAQGVRRNDSDAQLSCNHTLKVNIHYGQYNSQWISRKHY